MNNFDNKNVRREYLNYILKFDRDQFEKISYGKLLGLSIDQINMYAHPNFDANSMRVIIDCIMDGMDTKKIEVIANPEFQNLGKIIQTKIGFELGLTIDQVKSYAKPEYTVKEMIDMRLKLLNNKEDKNGDS